MFKRYHRFRYFIIGFTLLIVLGVTGALLYKPVISTLANWHAQPPSQPTTSPLALGVFIPGEPETGGPAIDAYSQMVGGTPAIVMWYASWPATFDTNQLDPVTARGAVPMISMNPYAHTHFSDAEIANGAMDTYLHTYAHNAAAWGKPLYYRFAWEMNGLWMHYAPQVNGNTTSSFVAMWRHVVDIFHAEHAWNVKWVWSPNDIVNGVAPDFRPMYPGDQYVDWVALDGYNWGTSHPGHKWHSFADEFSRSYTLLTAMTDKPLMIGETGSSEVGGDKSNWIYQAFFQDIPQRFPRLRAVIWFNMNKETDWRVNSSPAALEAFHKVATSNLYQGRLIDTDLSLQHQPSTPIVIPIHGKATPPAHPTPTPHGHGNATAVATATTTQPGTTPTPTATVAATTTGPATYSQSFEDGGLDGWNTYGAGTTLHNSSDFSLDGKHSLQVVYDNTSTNYHHASISSDVAHITPLPGQTLSAYIYIPDDTSDISAHIFIEDGDHTWNALPMQNLIPGQWNLLTYTIPATVKTPIYDMGIQFACDSGSAMKGSVYIDGVKWS